MHRRPFILKSKVICAICKDMIQDQITTGMYIIWFIYLNARVFNEAENIQN